MGELPAEWNDPLASDRDVVVDEGGWSLDHSRVSSRSSFRSLFRSSLSSKSVDE